MSEASQSKLLNDASDLRKSLGRARDVLRGMEVERETARIRLDKLRNEATAHQLKLDVVLVECKNIEQQVAKLDAAIEDLSGMLTQFSGLGEVRLPKPLPVLKASLKGAPKRTAEQVVNDANLRRLAIIELCAQPRTLPDIRTALPKIPVNTLRPVISKMVKEGYLKNVGAYGSYLYSQGPRARQAPPADPSIKASVAAVAVVAAPVTASAEPKSGTSLRSTLLKMILAGPPRTAADFYPIFPKANQHTIQSALSGLAEQEKISRIKIAGARYFKYCAPGTKTATTALQSSTQSDRILAACKTPMPFGDLAKKLPDINRHVLHQTVHLLVQAKRLRTSGKRHGYVYETVS